MSSQAEREANYIWKSHMRDSVNLTRFDSEAQLWVRAFENASRPKPTFNETIGTIGLVLSFIVNLIWLVGLILVKLFKWISKW